MVHGRVELVDAGGRPLPERTRAHRKLFRSARRHPVTYADYAPSCRCLSSTILVGRDVFDEVGLYDSSLHTEDYDFYLRLLLAYDVLFLDGAPVAEYRVHEEQVPDYQLGMGQIETAEKHPALLEKRDDVPDAQLARRNFHLMIARTWRALDDRRKARAAAFRALKLGAPQAVRLTL